MQFDSPPEMEIDTDRSYSAEMETSLEIGRAHV